MWKLDSWLIEKLAERKKINSLEIWCWRRALWLLWTISKKNKWVLEHIKPETLLEAKMTKRKLPYFRHITRRQSSLEKIMMLGENRRRQERETK